MRTYITLGVLVGAAFGIANLIATQFTPLADDTPGGLAMFYLPMFAIWGIAGFAAFRRTGRLLHAIKVGAIVGVVTFAVFSLANVLRVNIYLDVIKQREDWRNLVANYQTSGFSSLRLYANYVYASTTPLMLAVASAIGATTGLIGGAIAKSAGSFRPGPALRRTV